MIESPVSGTCQGTLKGTGEGSDQEDLAQLPLLLQLVIVTQHIQPLIFSQACHLEHPIHHSAVAPCLNPAHHHMLSLPSCNTLFSTTCITAVHTFALQWGHSVTHAPMQPFCAPD